MEIVFDSWFSSFLFITHSQLLWANHFRVKTSDSICRSCFGQIVKNVYAKFMKAVKS